MHIKINVSLFLFFLGLQFAVAQEKIKFRFGINTIYDASNYGYGNYKPANNEFYTFRKVGLTGINRADDFNHFWGIFTGAGTTFNFSLEKNISKNNILGLGVMLNDHVGGGYRLMAQSNIYVYGSTSTLNYVYDDRLLEYNSYNSIRYFVTFDHNISTIFKKNVDAPTPERINVKTELHLAANVIQILPSTGSAFDRKIILKTGDSLIVSSRALDPERKFGFSLVGGFNFKLQTKNNKEIVCIGINYEQGLFNLGGVAVVVLTQNYQFEERVFFRGSRLSVMLSRSFGKPNFKKKTSNE